MTEKIVKPGRPLGARGKKNNPSNEQFKNELKVLSLELIRELTRLCRNKRVGKPEFIFNAAKLIIPLHAKLLDDTDTIKDSDVTTEQPKKAELFSLTAIKK